MKSALSQTFILDFEEFKGVVADGVVPPAYGIAWKSEEIATFASTRPHPGRRQMSANRWRSVCNLYGVATAYHTT